jgi:hypothetical protein
MNKITRGSRGTIYYTIQMHPLSLSERDVASAFEQARFDPRLMEIITEFIRDFWWAIDPVLLNKACKKEKSPFMVKAVTSVILDQCEIDIEDHRKFASWVQYASRGIRDPSPQLLYVGVVPVASRMVQDEITNALPCFRKHGLIAKDLPFNKGRPGILKSEAKPALNKISELDYFKFKIARSFKRIKLDQSLSNTDIIQKTGVNRVFLSKLLNNKLENISAEYLEKKYRILAALKM